MLVRYEHESLSNEHNRQITSVTLSVFETIIFLSILGKDSTAARTETSIWFSASPRRGDEVQFRGWGTESIEGGVEGLIRKRLCGAGTF